VGPLASVLMNIGEFEEAVRVLRARLAVEPTDVAALGSLAMAMNYLPGVPAEEVANVHRRFGAAMSAGAAPAPARRDTREGALKVGFLSPDLYEHSVAAFLEPILAHRDSARIRTVCYSTRSRQDDTTRRLMKLADEWRDVAGRGDAAVAAQIRADGVDILIDLAGLTGMAELRVMARRPAPVQMTAIGYPNTTGMAAIGYRLVDEVTDPPGSEVMATEELVRVAGCFLCFQPPADAPDVAPAPCGETGR
jgi:predicted O-linked N-acetylglucosamine transferase (SPINDLY family)